MHKPSAQQDFVRDPEAAMRAAGLSPQHASALLTRDVGQLAEAVAEEVRAIESPRPLVPWISNHIVVRSISPTSGARGSTVRVVVSGAWFQSAVKVELLLGGTSVLNARVDSVRGAGTNRSSARCTVHIPADADVGAWDVKVSNGGEDYATLGRAFTVT